MYKGILASLLAVCFAAADIPLETEPSWVWDDEQWAYGGLAFADADDDGDLDLIAGCYNGTDWYPPIPYYNNLMFYNDYGELGDTYDWQTDVQRHTTEVATGDLNSDGIPDIFFANGGFSFNPDSVYYGAPGGPNTSPDWSSIRSAWATGVCLGDIDGDGDLDAATANEGVSPDPDRPAYIYWNDGSGLIQTPGWSSADLGVYNGVSLGDVDGADFAQVTGEQLVGDGSRVTFYLEKRPLVSIDDVQFVTFEYAYSYDLYAGWITFCRPLDEGEVIEVDYTYSTKLDVAVAKWSNFATGVYFNSTGVPDTSPGWDTGDTGRTDKKVIFFDFDLDDDQDLLVVGSGEYAQIYENDGGTLGDTPAWQSDNELHANDALVGDFDGDGYQDVVIANYPYRGVSVWENLDGIIETEPTWQYTADEQCRAVAVGDVNADGALDLAAGFSRDPLVVFLSEYTTDVSVTEFRAEGFNDRAVLSWRVASGEAVGFDIFRRDGAGPRIGVNSELIGGEPPFRYVDEELSSGLHSYYLKVFDASGRSETFGPVECYTGAKPGALSLAPPALNPVTNGTATFVFSVPENGWAELAVYDIKGRKVADIYSGDAQRGEHMVEADLVLTPGVYVSRLSTGSGSVAGKMVVLR
ncbi:MAG: T9SS type A sorting domain-containing protein [Candidatus Coatesbacteria bacterium]|nr:MAG: T9SS type A sorting domain-containing protein [Candidatus Coatesbacteria bacterium]